MKQHHAVQDPSSSKSIGNHIRQRFRLRTTLVIPFMLQLFAVVGLVDYLSFRNSQRAVDDLANQLNGEISARIEQHVVNYLNKSQDTLWLTSTGVRSGNFDLNNFEGLRRYFWQVVHKGNFEGYLSYGNEKGEFVGVEYREGSTVQLKIRTSSTAPLRETYELDNQGERQKRLKAADYDPRTRPWYKAAVKAGKPTWSEIYPFFSSKNTILGISPVYPLYDDKKQLLGVLCINVRLTRITDFINHLFISPNGQSFIIERSGNLVASSKISQPFKVMGEGEARKVERIPAAQSANPIVKATAQHLLKRFGSFQALQSSQRLKFQADDGAWYYVQILPIQDGRGIDWLTVVVVPENDFMAQINQNNYNTLFLCLAALGIAIVIGIRTAHWITRPLLRISQASEALAKGNLDQRVDSSAIVEVDTLSQSFNSMAGQLQDSFTALRQSEARNRALLEAIPDLMLEIDREGVYIDCLEAKEVTIIKQYQPKDLIGLRIHDMLPDDLVQDYLIAIAQALDTHETQTLEYSLQADNQVHTYESRVVASDQRSALFMVRDITQRKQAEESLRLLNEELEQRVERRTTELRKEKERSEQLLLNVLPATIADRLKRTDESPAEHFDEATILFADIVGFTSLSARMEPMKLVAGLNHIFSAFDHLTEKYGLEKIKTIGDAYMVVGGLPIPRADHATAIANMALDMQAYMNTLDSVLGESLQIRIGINTGPVIAGVIGIKKFIYDLWGDAVNVASRMESHGEPGYIQVTEATYVRLKEQFLLEPRGTIVVKGRGEMTTYWLIDRCPEVRN